MESAETEKQKLIALLKTLESNPSSKIQLSDQQSKQLAEAIKKLLKKNLH